MDCIIITKGLICRHAGVTKCPVLKILMLQLQLHLNLQINPLRPNIHFQILETDLHSFPQRIC